VSKFNTVILPLCGGNPAGEEVIQLPRGWDDNSLH